MNEKREPRWDPKKAESNFRKHRIHFEEAVEVIYDPLAKTRPDAEHSQTEDRRIAIGSTIAGDILTVSYTIREDELWIISARNARPAERRRYMTEKDTIRDAVFDFDEDDDDMLPDYGHLEGWEPLNFVTVRPVCVVVLDPDVYNVFHSSEEVNAALRGLIAEDRYPTQPDAPDCALPKSRRRGK